jgi:hypothetical protein
MAMKTVFLFIPQSAFLSDLLRTRYTEYLASKYRVTIFTPVIDQETARRENYYQNQNIEYIKWEDPNKNILNRFKYLRPLLIRKFDRLITVRQTAGINTQSKSRRVRLIKLIARLFSKILTPKFFTALEKRLIKIPPEIRRRIQKDRPSLIITATPGFNYYDGSAILLGKRCKIPTLAANFSWDNLTSESHMMRHPDYLLTWNEVAKKEALELHGYPADRVFTTGIMRFDHYFSNSPRELTREEFLRSKNLNPALKTILFTTVSPIFHYQHKHLRSLMELREKKFIPYTNIFIRIHPFDEYSLYQQYSGLKDVRVEKAGKEFKTADGEPRIEMNRDDLINLKNTLRYTDLNINLASTISLEASIFDKPIINFVEPGKEYIYELHHYKPLVEMGAVRLARNAEEYQTLIVDYLNNPRLDSEQRKALVDKYVPLRDGLAYKRAVDYLDKLIINYGL